MEKIVIVEQDGIGKHSAAAWKKSSHSAAGGKCNQMEHHEKVDIAQQRGKSGHNGASWKR